MLFQKRENNKRIITASFPAGTRISIAQNKNLLCQSYPGREFIML